jgi:hypothetical protein
MEPTMSRIAGGVVALGGRVLGSDDVTAAGELAKVGRHRLQ